GIIKTHNITGIGIIDYCLFRSHKSRRVREFYISTKTMMSIIFISFENSRADSHECNSVSMSGIHIGVDFEHKSRKSFFRGLNYALLGLPGPWRGSNFNEAIQEFLHTKI